ncbi:MAG TPA: hypothetical protein VGQ35_01865 [Dongiaceae bacterium]|jgi:hypothetical protein|nr:hypothetical protein [Dongiaceae bacterium]
MSSISVKAVIVGGLFDVVTSFVAGFILTLAIALSSGVQNIEEIKQASGSETVQLVATVIGAAISVAAGYLAARMAGRGELINGSLSSFLCAAIGIYTIAARWPEHAEASDFIKLAVVPPLGLLGGYLRLRQVRSSRQ